MTVITSGFALRLLLIGSRSSCSALILGLLIYKVISHDCHSGFIELKIIFRE